MMIASRSVSPETGKLFPNYDTHGDRVVDAIRLTIDLYVPTDSQEALIRQMRTFHRACAGLRGVPLPGRGLSAVSQAGKSRTITEFARRTNAASRYKTAVPATSSAVASGSKLMMSVSWAAGLGTSADPAPAMTPATIRRMMPRA